MKKLMMALVAVACAAVAQAGTVSWGSGTLYTAADANGGWSTTGAMAAQQLITMSVYLVDSTTYASVSALDQKGIYDWAADKTADYSATNHNGTKYIGAATAKDTNAPASTTYNAIILATYSDTNIGKDFYIANATTGTTSGTGMLTTNNLVSTVGASAGWQVVPEPTSGLMMLLGMGVLALRRRRA